MLKMYHPNARHGGSSDFWEENWEEVDYEEALRFCEVDPLRPLFERYAKPGAAMLEGGCGQGQNVAFYAARGVKVVGLDFAVQTLSRLRQREAALMLCAGDVAALPFRDESFDLYYSGGVVEHFEGGAEAALREARRVLRPGKILMISAPYFSPLRQVLSIFKSKEQRRVSAPSIDAVDDNRLRFFQYAYTRREFGRMLSTAGFRVVSTQGYSILWGLQELPLATRAMSAFMRKGGSVNSGPVKQVEQSEVAPQVQGNSNKQTMLKRLVVSEDHSVPVAGSFVRMLRWASANMMMYVCSRN